MAFLLNGRTLPSDAAFEHDGYSYPANWLRLSTPQEKAALGITEVSDFPDHDQRFYWGLDQEGMPIPKDHEQLKSQWVAVVKESAGQLLAQTDWMVIRELDADVLMPADVKAHRAAIRQAASAKEQALLATADTAALAALVTGGELLAWPSMADEATV